MCLVRSVTYVSGPDLKTLEARVGFEPTNGGFADLSLGPLGYRAEFSSITNLSQRTGRPCRQARQHNYFFSVIAGTLASRINLADSSGGVGLI